MKRFAFALAATVVVSPARADEATFRTVQYKADPQTAVRCPVGFLCTVRLQAGERVRDGLNSQVPSWDPCDGQRQSQLQSC
jgi:hypothetical protein